MDTKGSSDTLPSGILGLGSPALDARYDLVSVIGRGGMGEVRLGRDRRIGREVAVKLMRSDASDEAAMTRFFREAHVQGLLEHPSVVPIHDLGVDANGNPFFVMKRVTGTTLADVLARPPGSHDWSRAQLLARFVDVCHAIELAHSRGVIHRDLKPANIMLGEFGETYVLDWGLARVVATRQSVTELRSPAVGELETQAGDLLGTPGYMSPEQARGEAVEPATDVYALGVVLFEILTGQPALPRGLAAIAETLSAAHHRPSSVRDDVALELDELCMRATDQQPENRPSAHELAVRIQAHVEGDRDLERREKLAVEHAQRASEAEQLPTDADRALAMHEAGRALALDPANADAQRILGRLLLETPTSIPAEAIASADVERGRTRQGVLKMAGYGYLWMIVAVAVLMMMPVHDYTLLGVTGALALATGGLALALSKRLMPMWSPWFMLLLALNCTLITMSGLLFTPLLIMPIFFVGSLTGWLQQPVAHHPWIVVAAHVVPFAAVLVLEGLGILPSTYRITGGSLVVSPWVVDLTPAITTVIFAVTFAAQGLTTVVVMLQNRYSQQAAQDRLHAHAWHLRQLLPRAHA